MAPAPDIADIVDYERPHTWPQALTNLLDDNAETLKAYERERARIDALCEADIYERGRPQWNRHKDERDQVVDRADEILSDERLLGFHCTRLADDEISDIRANGLNLPGASLLEKRISGRVQAGEISENLGRRLLNKHQAEDPDRRGRLAFVNMRAVLRSESAVGWLFRCWGGEALYNWHESDPETGPLLRQIGRPCIWTVAVPIRWIRSPFNNVGERFVWAYLTRCGVATGHAADIQSSIAEPLPPDEIIDIVRYEDPAFEALTGCSTWRDPIW